MRLEMAPLEGMTTYLFRKVYSKYYGHIDKYYTPFLSLHKEKEFNHKERQEVLPENNKGLWVVPQVLTNSVEDFLRAANTLKELGYEEVNINLGCPSGTVVPKGKGAGMLAEPERLEQFLVGCFEKTPVKISVKTRLGMEKEEEWEKLLAIYNKFPLEELIVHARIREDYYKNPVRLEAFGKALEESLCTVCYNGDIFGVEDYVQLTESFPKLKAVMLGRGLLRNPGLAVDIVSKWNTEEKEPFVQMKDKEKIQAFHDELYAGYQQLLGGDRNVLFKMKELWSYLIFSFPEKENQLKKLNKLKTCAEYESWLRIKADE
ncbi:MAG: tRNA-dihydrouridine synthase family protein [Lachnospiraceae bacterium]|nr:tRNA-dihydrouridine synthase family protein [Lachnospiraceae bacterium]MBR4083697.1 tRNA-dihydrouridine synthase family protein [Lachnospiraceae bacterium]